MLHIYPCITVKIIGVLACKLARSGWSARRIFYKKHCNCSSTGLCYHESGNSALPDISELDDQSDTSVWNCGTGAALSHPPVLSASFPFTQILPVWLSHYHYCYGVETHKQKQPCTDPADPQHTYTLESKNNFTIKNTEYSLTFSKVKSFAN
ncbi:hypothetical protein T07_6179 [Trichinella nelsoni]|uniref:Uncharacterized protein n=1 Tax=Trichinella nelsoni TaxID=6336 RepID=A0A0V0SMC6_9BILA|nr:hypothetical protein T07_6179 [Trichinella nelsoni]